MDIQQPQIQPLDLNKQMSEAELEAMLRQKLMQSMEAQRQMNAADTERLKQNLSQPVQMDLSPTMALIDYLSGAKGVGASYKAPGDREAQIQQGYKDVRQGKQNLTDDEINLARALRDDARGRNALDRESATNARMQKRMDREILLKFAASPEKKQMNANLNLIDKVNNYENVFKQLGSKASLTGEEKALIDSAQAEAAIAWKEAANLGALQGPDLALIQQSIGESPTTGNAFLGYTVAGGAEGLMSKIDNAKRASLAAYDRNLKSAEQFYAEPSTQSAFDYFRTQAANAGATVGSKNKNLTIKDIDKMTPEELKKFVGE